MYLRDSILRKDQMWCGAHSEKESALLIVQIEGKSAKGYKTIT